MDPHLIDITLPSEAMPEESPTQKGPYSAPKLAVHGSLVEHLAERSTGAQPGREDQPAPSERAASWYGLDLVEVDGVGELVEDLWKLALEVSRYGGEPDYSNAVFLKIRPGKAATLYFSPAAEPVAVAFGAVPCNRPSPRGMSLVAGDERAWQIHFGRVFARRATRGFEDTLPSDLADLTKASPLQ